MLRRLGGKTQTIGLVLEDVANPFSSALHRAIEDTARARGVLVFAGSCDEDPLRERELIGSFRDRRVDGIIVVPASDDHTYLYGEQRAGTALVFVDRPAGHLDADSVGSDNVGGAVDAVEHLLGARPPTYRLPRRPPVDLDGSTNACGATGRHSRRAGIAVDDAPDPDRVCATPRSPRAAVKELLALPIRRLRSSRARTSSTIGGIRALAERRARASDRAASASTTSRSPTSSIRRSRSSRRTRRRSAGRPPSSCSAGSTATLRRRCTTSCRSRLIARGSGEITPNGRAS